MMVAPVVPALVSVLFWQRCSGLIIHRQDETDCASFSMPLNLSNMTCDVFSIELDGGYYSTRPRQLTTLADLLSFQSPEEFALTREFKACKPVILLTTGFGSLSGPGCPCALVSYA
jgi:hypothetical protein